MPASPGTSLPGMMVPFWMAGHTAPSAKHTQVLLSHLLPTPPMGQWKSQLPQLRQGGARGAEGRTMLNPAGSAGCCCVAACRQPAVKYAGSPSSQPSTSRQASLFPVTLKLPADARLSRHVGSRDHRAALHSRAHGPICWRNQAEDVQEEGERWQPQEGARQQRWQQQLRHQPARRHTAHR